jgi:hypothetical protein
MTFPIEKNIPVPAFVAKKQPKYPFLKMKVGDSFLSATDSCERISPSMALFHKKYPNKRFTCRKVEGGARVWRVK